MLLNILIVKYKDLRICFLVENHFKFPTFDNSSSLIAVAVLVAMFPQDIEILGWYPAEPVLPHAEKVPLYSWLATLLVMVSQ